MAAPRSTGYFRLHAQDTTFLSDASIVPPVPGFQGYTPSMSPQLHAAVTLVNTGPATGMSKPTVGLGAAGAPLIGEVVTVHPDGATVVQDVSILTRLYNRVQRHQKCPADPYSYVFGATTSLREPRVDVLDADNGGLHGQMCQETHPEHALGPARHLERARTLCLDRQHERFALRVPAGHVCRTLACALSPAGVGRAARAAGRHAGCHAPGRSLCTVGEALAPVRPR